MVNKLLKTSIGLRTEDDRDNYSNKRVEMAGVLCCELFRTLFKRFTKNIEIQLERKKQRPDVLSIISRNTSITLGLKHAFCFPAGTLITMSNGLSMPIERLSGETNENEKVYGWNGNGLTVTKHGGLINQGMKDTIKLTLEDGRTVTCTKDHKILILKENKTTEWVEALQIPINSRIVCGLEYPEDIIGDDFQSKWKIVINDIAFSLENQNERNKTMAFMRILGYIICDGHMPVRKNNQGAIYLGTIFDVNTFIEDYKLVTGIEESPGVKYVETENWGSNYMINISNKFTHLIKSIKGVLIGKKVTQERKIPLFLLEDDCPKNVIREFLGGMFGADGHCPRLDIRNGKRTSTSGIKFSWTTEDKNLDILKNLFENICKLLEKVGVKNAFLNGPYECSSGASNRFFYSINLPSNTDFTKYVGFRYCIHKSYKASIISSYLRMCEEIKRQHDFIIKEVDILKENDKKMTVKKALEIARNKLIEKEYIMNEYYSLSSERDILKRREKGRSKTLECLEEKYDVLDAKDFIKNMGCLYMFEGEYVLKKDSKELPIFSLKLMDIRNDKKQVVYDITNVKICQSFLANGIVGHNSTGSWGVQKNNYIRTGVSQVLSRMTFSASLSHLRRIVIPVGKEGKNTKIRQTHSSQIMYICNSETPEGQSIGIVLNLALSTTVTRRIPTVVVKEIIENCDNFVFLNKFNGKNDKPKIFLNGILVGITPNLEEFMKELKAYRKNGLLDKDISFTYNKIDNEVKIFSDEGRFIRPIFTLNEEGKLNVNEKIDSPDWDELLEKQYVQYIDNSEIENSVVAMDEKDLVKYKNDFCEICPAMMMGVVASLIPFPEHCPSARNIFQSNMGQLAQVVSKVLLVYNII
jgi:intein/homing endonuclease